MATYREPWEYWEDRCEREDEYEKLCPVCDICGEHITDETYLDIDGLILHKGCITDFEKWTEDYVINEEEKQKEATKWTE